MSPNLKCPRTRLYIKQAFISGADIFLDEKQTHYLANVLRQQAGNSLVVFNGEDGEWIAKIAFLNKKRVTLILQKQLRSQKNAPDLWLLAAPLRSGKTETVIEQATELGISRFIPVSTQFTVASRINQERLVSVAIEASEQCERMDIPCIESMTSFQDLIARWNPDRTIIYGDESGAGKQPDELFPHLTNGKYAMLIGPEGGFSSSELELLRKAKYALGMCMGPRIMRAPTAAIAAITLIQSRFGDWDNKPAFRNIEN